MALYLILVSILVLTVYCVQLNKGQLSAALAYDKSNAMKGLLALLIVFHHLVFEADLSSPVLEIFKYIAFPLVSVFFFFSGYGLVKSYYKHNKIIDLKSFCIKRMTRLLIPYIIVVCSYGIYAYIKDPAAFSLPVFLADVFLAREIGPLWYMTVIFFVYAVYAVCFRFLEPVTARRLILAITVIYIVLCILFSVPSQWYSSIIGFYIGILYGMNESKVNEFLNKKYLVTLCALFMSFAFLFCLRLIISAKITDSEFLHGPFRSIIDIVFILFLISLLESIEIRKPLMGLAGKISYELYLIHPVIIYILRDKIVDNAWYCVIAFACSIGLAYVLNALNSRVAKLI